MADNTRSSPTSNDDVISRASSAAVKVEVRPPEEEREGGRSELVDVDDDVVALELPVRDDGGVETRSPVVQPKREPTTTAIDGDGGTDVNTSAADILDLSSIVQNHAGELDRRLNFTSSKRTICTRQHALVVVVF